MVISAESVFAFGGTAGGTACIAVIVAFVLRHFAEKGANRLAFITSVWGTTVSISIVAVVPHDVQQALHRESEGADHAAHALRKSWAAIYWSTAFLCYVLCPILMEYEASGEFTVQAKLQTSLRRNFVFYAAYILIALILIAVLLLTGKVQGDLQSWSIAASNAWGLLVLTILMGYGLVAVPRHLWALSDPSSQLRMLYINAVAKDEMRLSRHFDLQDVTSQVDAELINCQDDAFVQDLPLKRGIAVLQETVERNRLTHWELTHSSRGPADAGFASSSRPRDDFAGGRPAPSIAHLAELHRSLKAAAREARRASCVWDAHIQRCLFFEDLQREQFKAAADFLEGAPARGALFSRSAPRLFWHRLLVMWLKNLRMRTLCALAYAASFLSTVIVLGQLTMFMNGWNLSLLSLLFKRDHGPFVTELFCVVPLSYMTYTAYFSIFRMKISGWYGLYGNQNTDICSLLFCSSILARLAAPLCYHFMLLVKVEGTTFQEFMGQMNVVPALGESFNEVFPIIIALLCCLNILNVYSRIVNCLSFGSVDFELAAVDEEMREEGRVLVERERRRRAEEMSMLAASAG